MAKPTPVETFEESWERVKPPHPPTDEQLDAIAAVLRQAKPKAKPSSSAA